MEASLPTSAAIKTMSERTISAPFGANAASTLLPLSFILCGLAALTTGIGWLTMRPAILATYHYNQQVIAVTHLFVLGAICSILMGAMYQLVPVALETKLYSEKLAHWQFAFHVVGFTGMVWMFRVWNMTQVGHFGSVLAVGVGLFVYNMARTLRRVPRWNITASAVSAALIWFSITIIAGLTIAITKSVHQIAFDEPATSVSAVVRGMQPIARFMSRFETIGTMHAHAHLGGVGFFTMLLVGVSYKLIPMFTLSEVQSKHRAACSVALLNIGLAGSFVTILLHNRWKVPFAFIMVAAIGIYGWELTAILRARKRRVLDWGITYFLTAVALLLPVSLLAIVLSWPGLPINTITGQLENLYGFLGLVGVVTFAIIGMLYKIVPFLIWFRRYSPEIGRARVPALAEMYSKRLQALGYWTWLAGLAVICVAIVCANQTGVRWGSALLALSVATLGVNVGTILTHFFRPKLTRLAIPSAIPPKPA